jgi:hypothetical protein
MAAIGLLIAWLALGLYAVQHPEVQKHLTRFVPMSIQQGVYFRFHMALLALPIHPSILEVIAVILVWIAFLRADWSDRMLFSAAVILSSTALFGGTEYAFYSAFTNGMEARWFVQAS